MRRIMPALAASLLFVGCATTESPGGPALPRDLAHRPDGRAATPWPSGLTGAELRDRIVRLIPPRVKDRTGWAGDLASAFGHLDIVHADETYCAAIAVIEQESGFQVDPVVPGLPAIVQRELDRRADEYGVPRLLVTAALLKTSPDGRSYRQRIETLKTERELSALFEDLADELPFGRRLLADYNPVRTGGPMQVSVRFAEQQAKETDYPYRVEHDLRAEVFSRQGGLYFGSAILLDYPVPYDDVAYRFADFNAGRYSSRNAAFQAAVGRLTKGALSLDGDLLRYEDGKPAPTPGEVETALRTLSGSLKMDAGQIRHDLMREKEADFERTQLYGRVFALAEQHAGKALPRAQMPRIKLKSPKITRKLTTEWFARRVAGRYRDCLARGS